MVETSKEIVKTGEKLELKIALDGFENPEHKGKVFDYSIWLYGFNCDNRPVAEKFIDKLDTIKCVCDHWFVRWFDMPIKGENDLITSANYELTVTGKDIDKEISYLKVIVSVYHENQWLCDKTIFYRKYADDSFIAEELT